MTDEERRDRNPAPELEQLSPAAMEVKYPRLRVSDLELGHVYVLQSEAARWAVSLNYVGREPLFHPKTLQPIAAHLFAAPRVVADAAVVLVAAADGIGLEDLDGDFIVLRQYAGEDA